MPSERDAPTCANCGAELVSDQRYCLACGHPVSAVRLSFLDVLQEDVKHSGQALEPGTIRMAPVAYAPVEERGLGGWLARNAGVLGLLAVLIVCLIAGLLVGHWVTEKNGGVSVPPTQTVKIEGLGALAAPTAASSTATSAPGAAKAPAKGAKAEEAAEAKEAAQEEASPAKAKPAAPTKLSTSKQQKIKNSTGRKHQEELNSVKGPIEG